MSQATAPEPSNAGPPADETRLPFPIVGVGASAGGLAATTELLRHLGPQPRIAVVIVPHLDPAHESSMVGLLSRVTTLPVHAVSDGMRVEPNHIYVVPPNADMLLRDGALHLMPRSGTGSSHHPIDRFFESLAAESAFHSLGVVLTGTGSDGAIGIRAIKAEGGITFAQDGSAAFRSMPENAIATGCVDFILSPEGIARELLRIGERAPLPPSSLDDTPEFQRILAELRRSSGIDFANYKQTTLRRRVQRRVVVTGLLSLREYAELVERNPDELRVLCDEVLIHVTSFFRDPEMFQALKTAVFPRLLENRPRDAPIRAWVVGCSSGEEVYSIAMSLLEFLADTHAEDIPIKLVGTDVSSGAIDKARAGKYPASIEQDVSPGRLERFFVKQEGAYLIRKHVRDLCIFAKHDVTRDPPFAGMDLISCRNLMIYLGLPLQDRILPLFHYALKERGFLVLGPSETVRSFPGFSPLDAKNKIYARTAAAPRAVFSYTEQRRIEPAVHEVAPGTKQAGPVEAHREADRLLLAEFAPPGVVITDDLAIIQFRGRTGPFLEPAPGVPSFDLLRLVREELRIPLRQTIDDARSRQAAVRKSGLVIAPTGSTPRSIEIEVIPFRVPSDAQRFFVVLFRDPVPPPTSPVEAVPAPVPGVAPSAINSQLAQELASVRDYLQSVIEQLEASNEELRAANEEIVASNEELRSTNDELQRAKTELQATNEELSTVNDEMAARNLEATRISDDLMNILSSVEIPIVILGRDSRIRRFTPTAAKVFHLIAGDIGRPISDTRSIIPAPELKAMITEVLEHLSPVVRTAQDEDGCWYQLSVRPYLTLDNRIDGTVVSAFDIDAMIKGAQMLSEAQKFAESIIDNIPECLVVLDKELCVRSANQTFLQTFGAAERELQGQSLDELGRGDSATPALRKQLTELAAGGKLEGVRVEWESRRAGRRTFLLNARRIEKTPSILLALADITEKERAAQQLHRTEKLQEMAFDAALIEERERRRIAADLHDRIGQSLALAQIRLSSLRESLTGPARDALDQTVQILEQSIGDTRTLIFELSPPVLYELGLKDALSWLIEEVEKRHGMHIELVDDGAPKPLDDGTAALVFRAVRELIMNVFKHARSQAARVSLRRTGDTLEVDVEDQGAGFDPNSLPPPSTRGGFGLFSIREQISRLRGTVEVLSAPQKGTRVGIRVPLKPGDPAKPEAKEVRR